ncbi:hypothetical protein D3C73_1629950 [compost metagenome]
MGDRPDMGHDVVGACTAHGTGQAFAHQRFTIAEGQHRRLQYAGAARGVVQNRQLLIGGIAVQCLLIAHV